MTINEVIDAIDPLLDCGTLTLFAKANPAKEEQPPYVTVGIMGGAQAMAAASDDDILLAMRNATKIADLLRREQPKHWEVRQ